jgi:putative acetyltransferase
MPPVIRRYKAADLDAVIGVFLRSVRNVGSRDYDAAQIAARVQRLAVLHTHVSITARLFFEKHGFQVVRSQVVALRDQQLTNLRMEKQLRAV